ncbi:tail fiber protein [Alisedimentitalea sp. MJ-SS2]|uniref:phage tail protein n=1 Tax=Aliisedimentitalea sp. MJ-SS2 TaxID=3049795 RepID=UPI00290D8E99|nr:tail fiber protein [Alisedimentitalea sp. MJ-SS2]MDU8930044.1 tail fiber protein [Alisedimentitalea sp. MJ-SS2]
MRHFLTMKVKTAALALSACLPAAVAQADADPMLGDLMPVGFNFCPRGWAAADGQLLPISSNQSLYSLLGTMYGGDGRTSFALPDLRGRMPVHNGTASFGSYTQGQRGGATTATMTIQTMPAHSHLVNATNAQGDKLGPGGDYLADPNTNDPNTELHIYHDGGVGQQIMNAAMISNTGGSQTFGVQDPFLAVNWCIALQGIFPSRN